MTMFIDELPLLIRFPSNTILATELCTLPATTYLWVYLIYDSATKDPVQRNMGFTDTRLTPRAQKGTILIHDKMLKLFS